MREHGLEIPMSQSTEGSTTESQPMYVGEDDQEWMKIFNHKKGCVNGFGKIQPCPTLSKRISSAYASTSNKYNVDQLESLKIEIARLNQVNQDREENFLEMQSQMQKEQKEMREMIIHLMESRPTISTVFKSNYLFQF